MQAKIASQLLVLVAVCLRMAEAAAEEISADKLPKAIVDRIHTRFPKTEIVGAEMQRHSRGNQYVVEIKGPDGPFHVTFFPWGMGYDGKYVPGYLSFPVEQKFPKAEILYATEGDDAGVQSEAMVYLRHAKQNVIVNLSFGGGTGGWRIFSEYRQIAESDLPQRVLTAAQSKYPKASVRWAESLSTVAGVINSYEIWLTTRDNKTVTMSIAPDGEILSHGESEPPPEEKIFKARQSEDAKKK
jgi:hypothetical protein